MLLGVMRTSDNSGTEITTSIFIILDLFLSNDETKYKIFLLLSQVVLKKWRKVEHFSLQKFFHDLNGQKCRNAMRVSAIYDPVGKLVVWAFP